MGKLQSIKPDQGKLLKTPETSELPPQQRKPKFSFEYLRKTYCISNCEGHEKASFSDTMLNLSQLTWAQISNLPRHGMGYEKIDRSAIKDGIPSALTEDVNIIAFRFAGKAPMVGFRREDTFYVVWFDRDFTLYKH